MTQPQLTLDFEPSLLERHTSALSCVRQAAHTNRNPLKTIAADMDLSESELSWKLSQNDNDTRRFTLDDLEKFIQVTGDTTPIMYLAAKYLADQNAIKAAAQNQLARLLPEIVALMKAAS